MFSDIIGWDPPNQFLEGCVKVLGLGRQEEQNGQLNYSEDEVKEIRKERVTLSNVRKACHLTEKRNGFPKAGRNGVPQRGALVFALKLLIRRVIERSLRGSAEAEAEGMASGRLKRADKAFHLRVPHARRMARVQGGGARAHPRDAPGEMLCIKMHKAVH